MAIQGYNKDEVVDFMPEYNGNRDTDDPCIVTLKFIPYSRVQHYARVIAARTKNMANTAKITEVSQGVQKEQFIESVESISNYMIGDREVTDPAEFYETADTDLVIEVVKAMESQQRLSEGQRKNS